MTDQGFELAHRIRQIISAGDLETALQLCSEHRLHLEAHASSEDELRAAASLYDWALSAVRCQQAHLHNELAAIRSASRFANRGPEGSGLVDLRA